MSTPLGVSTIIETAVNNLGGFTFLRATDHNANISIDDIDLAASDIAIYNNRPEVSTDITDNGLVTHTWPIEISLLGLAGIDDDDVDADIIMDPLYTAAIKLFESIQGDPNQSTLEFPGGYDIDLGRGVKLYDKIVTGIVLSFDMVFTKGLNC